MQNEARGPIYCTAKARYAFMLVTLNASSGPGAISLHESRRFNYAGSCVPIEKTLAVCLPLRACVHTLLPVPEKSQLLLG